MADNKQELEYSLKFDSTGVDDVLRDVERIRQSVSTGAANPAAAASAAGFSSFDAPMAGSVAPLPPPPQPTTDPGIPVGSLGDYQQRVQAVQAIAPNAPDVANMAASRLQTSILNAAVQDPDSARDYQDLINSLKELRQSIQDDGKKKDGIGEMLGWMKAQALLQTTQQISSGVINNAMHGNLLSAGGGAAGALIGGALGALGGPAGIVTGLGMGSSIGAGIGGFVEQLLGGASGAAKYETQIADINQRFGLGSVGRLRNYDQGGALGFTVEQNAGIIDQLRENRALSNPAMAGPLVNVIQEMTRALGLNVEATTNMAGIYSRTGGEKGAEGVRGYLSDVVGGAIRAGFESNIQQYADMMGSARMMSTQQTGQAVSDRAFGMLQDVMAGLTGGNSRTSNLFRDNMQMAAGGLQTFMGFGGTTNPYSTSAAYMRLAGIGEASLDSRFNSPEQIAQNAQLGLRFTTDRLRQNAGMNAEEFNAAAARDPNFVQNLLRGNAGLQRQTTQMVSGFIGREASAQDLRAYEEMANIMAANGGRMPTGNNDGSRRVQQLMGQLQESPGDRARNLEAQAHNQTIKAMTNFIEAGNKLKEWQIDALKWIQSMDLKKVGEGIADAMDKIKSWANTLKPVIENAGKAMIDAAAKMRDAARDFSEAIKEFRESAIGRAIFGEGVDSKGIASQLGNGLGGIISKAPGPIGQALGAFSGGLDFYTRLFRGEFGNDPRKAWNYLQNARPDDRFNDTPGSVTAGPGYNVFAFAPGDVVSARMGGTSGGATLADIHQVLTEANAIKVQFEQNRAGQAKVLQDSTSNILATDLLVQANSDTNTLKQFPTLIELNQFLAKAATSQESWLSKIVGYLPNILGAIDSVRDAIASLSSITGGNAMGGTGVNQFPIPGLTLDSATITSGFGWRFKGGRPDFHEGVDIAVKGGTPVLAARSGTVSQIKPLGDQLQIAIRSVDEQGRQLEEWYVHTANALVKVGDQIQAGQQIAEVSGTSEAARRAGISTGDHLDYRVKVNGEWVDPRTMLRGLPAGGTQPAGGGARGRGVDLRSGYESLEQLSQQLTGLDPRFNTNTPEGRAALAMALAIGGTEAYGQGSRSTDFFTRRGGTSNNMLGFAQYNLEFHSGQTRTPQGYSQYLADMLSGDRRLPNGAPARDLSSALAQAVQSGQVNSGADLERWMRRNGLGGSNWQGIDDGWRRTPGLGDDLIRMMRGGGGPQASANRTNNITINIANAIDPVRTGQAVANALHPYLDEFEANRHANRNPRNNQSLSPVYG